MSTTLQQTINWAIAMLGYTFPTVGPNNEPAITHANMTKQTIEGPPFKWPWNRGTTSITCTAGTQDYVKAIADFGFIEFATMKNPTTNKTELIPAIYNTTPIGESIDAQKPTGISAQLDDGAGNITFRFNGVPDIAYTVIVTYQKAPVPFTALSDTWTTIPDRLQYVYNQGFLARALESKGDPRAQQAKIAFAAALLGNAEGLTETEKNFFLARFLDNTAQIQATTLKTQQGISARGQ